MRFAILSLVAQLCIAAPRRYPATGLVLAIDRPHLTVTISHESIPGFMDAMAMPFHVRTQKILEGLHAGDSVAFTLAVDRNASWVDGIRVVRFDSAERDPVQASRLKVLDMVTGKSQTQPLAIGEKAPDFSLIDQAGRPVALSAFAGKVVAIDFIYTRCPLPDYCFRLSNNFGRLQKRFAGTTGLVLLSVTFDPVHDGPEELTRYARIWKAEPQTWYFLTGPPADIQRVCALFGVGYWPDDGVFTHSLHTAILDREGKLVANLEGNKFTAAQLGDLVQTVVGRSSGK
jgi:protein SCO1/2